MKNSNRKKNAVNKFVYIFYIVTYLTIFIFFESNESIFDLKHYILFFCCIFTFLSFLLKNRKKNTRSEIRGKNFIYIAFTALLFIILSYIKSSSVGVSFNFRSIVQTSLFALPLLYSFCLINIFHIDDVTKLMKITTIIFIFFYFLEPKHTILSFFDLNNWGNIHLSDSMSFTESHICSETFLQLFLYFYYLYSYVDNTKSNRKFLIINFLFTFLSFKRLALLFALLIILFRKIVNYNRIFKFKLNNILSFIFIFLTIIYINLLTGIIDIGLDMNHLTTNRVWILSLWKKYDYYSYGYGTSLYVIGRYLEMDLVQIYFELGFVGLFTFCFSMFQIAEKKVYTNLIILYVLFNLLTSSTMPWASGWLILGINLFLFSSLPQQQKLKGADINEKFN